MDGEEPAQVQLIRRKIRCEQREKIRTSELETEEVESLSNHHHPSSKYKDFEPFQVVGKDLLADRQLHVAHTKLKTAKRNQVGVIT